MNSRSTSQLARSNNVKLGQLARAYFIAKEANRRGQMKKLEKLIQERIKQ